MNVLTCLLFTFLDVRIEPSEGNLAWHIYVPIGFALTALAIGGGVFFLFEKPLSLTVRLLIVGILVWIALMLIMLALS